MTQAIGCTILAVSTMIVCNDDIAVSGTLTCESIVTCSVLTEAVKNVHERTDFTDRLPAIEHDSMPVVCFDYAPVTKLLALNGHSRLAQTLSISMQVYAADQVMKVNPAIASVAVRNRLASMGAMAQLLSGSMLFLASLSHQISAVTLAEKGVDTHFKAGLS